MFKNECILRYARFGHLVMLEWNVDKGSMLSAQGKRA